MRSWTYWRVDVAGAVFCAAISLAAYLAVISPAMRSHDDRAARAGEAGTEQRRADELARSVVALTDRLDRVRRRQGDRGVALQHGRRVNKRVSDLTELMGRYGLTGDEIQVDPPVAGRLFDTIPIALRGRGSYVSLARFQRALATALPDVGVASFKVAGNPRAPDDGGTFDLALLWYAAPRTNPPAAGQTPTPQDAQGY